MKTFVLLSIGIPIIGSFANLLIKRRQNIISTVLIFAGFVTSCLLISPILTGTTGYFHRYFIEFFSTAFIADGLSVFMAVTASFIGGLIAIYSAGYMKDYEHLKEYYFYITLFVGSMLGLIFSANLLLMFIFWEITALCSWRLIGFYRDEKGLLAADRAFILTFLGSGLMLAGFAIVYSQYNTLNILSLSGKEIPTFAMILILCGMLAKSAQLPFHLWLPDAGVAPSPVTAFLHAAVLVKIGVYAFARLFIFTFPMTETFQDIVMILSVATILVAGASAFVENDIKRILAYSTISQIGYIFLGFATDVAVGITGAIFFILVHGLGKAGLFLSAGIVEHNTHEKDIRKLGGLSKTMPITSVAFVLCALSIIGFPPFGGFFSKLYVIMSVVQKGKILLASLAVLGAVLTLLYLFRLYNAVFLGTARGTDAERNTELTRNNYMEKTKGMVVIVLVLGLLSLLTGLFPQVFLSFIELIK
ncbi:MAG: NADH-quinone oxidoreductase subunit L [Elusimicrobia bacterium]|nr:NADH-quinone oxidoreductase subunit L [Elusimicrobiota bacterium]